MRESTARRREEFREVKFRCWSAIQTSVDKPFIRRLFYLMFVIGFAVGYFVSQHESEAVSGVLASMLCSCCSSFRSHNCKWNLLDLSWGSLWSVVSSLAVEMSVFREMYSCLELP